MDTLLVTDFFQVLSVEEDFNTRATDEWRVWKVTAKYRGPKNKDLKACQSGKKKLSETQKVVRCIARDLVSQLL